MLRTPLALDSAMFLAAAAAADISRTEFSFHHATRI
jgi:hypothetical protein